MNYLFVLKSNNVGHKQMKEVTKDFKARLDGYLIGKDLEKISREEMEKFIQASAKEMLEIFKETK